VVSTLEDNPTPPQAPNGTPPQAPLYRKEAARAGMSPPERLDELTQVTSRRGWIALCATIAIIIAGICYGVLAKAPNEVTGNGILLPPSGLYSLGISAQGIITSLPAVDGGRVVAGQRVAVISDPTTGKVDRVVTTPVSGRVVELDAKVGQYNTFGTPIMTIEPTGGELQAVVYVPVDQAQSLRIGTPVRISPLSAPSSQYGTIEGKVARISPYPASPARIALLVGQNQPLIQTLSGAGAPIEVDVSLKANSSTKSGLQWTTKHGPPFRIEGGSLFNASFLLPTRSVFNTVIG
jgi:multidrug efflux pump subunit AcrA (membrane-fusion protein)